MFSRINKIFKQLLFSTIVFVILFSSFGIKLVSADNENTNENQQAAANYNACIIGVPEIATDQTKFPDIQVNMRVINNQYEPINNLLNTDLQIQENNSTQVYSKTVIPGQAAGADIYFVIDSGNHTNPAVVKKVLEAFHDIMLDGDDNISIINDQDSGYYSVAKSITSKDKFEEIIQSLPDQKNPNFYTLFSALDQTLKDVDTNRYSCSRPLFIVVIAGDVTFDNQSSRGYDYADEISKTFAKMLFVHFGDSTNNEYKDFTENLNGHYIDVASTDQISDLTRLISSISSFRSTYNVVYRSDNGGSGNHQLALFYQGQQMNVLGTDTYSIQLDTPSIVIAPQDTSILRVASKKTETGYVFDKNVEYIDINVDWKGYPRDITSAKLIVNNANPVDVKLEKINDSEYRVAWDMSGFDQRGTFPIKLDFQLTDELNEGIADRTVEANTSVQMINQVPASLMTTYLLYGLYILFGLMIIVFLIWRKKITASIVKGGKSIGEAVRKTIVGNRNNRKTPIAALEIIDGPQNLIGKELPIYSESVNLGRDPAKSDMIFYGPDSLTSVSGLHCKIQCLQNGWQIIALSSSKSETFLDDESLPFLNPVAINDGQKVRLGNYAQQPVEFIFHIKEGTSNSINDPKKTITIGSDSVLLKKRSLVPDPASLQNSQGDSPTKPAGSIPPPLFPSKSDPEKKDGSAFDEFR